jgi:multimeric flavodoxin WrbA
MNILVLNGSPRRKGTVAKLLKGMANGIDEKHKVEWIDVYELKMQPCIACMK